VRGANRADPDPCRHAGGRRRKQTQIDRRIFWPCKFRARRRQHRPYAQSWRPARPSSRTAVSGCATARHHPKAPNTSQSACPPFPWPASTATLEGSRTRRGGRAARPKFIAYNPYRCAGRVGPHHSPGRHELQRACAAKPRRPLYREFDGVPHRQFLVGGEQNSSTAKVQRLANTAGFRSLRQHDRILDILLDGKPAGSSPIWHASEFRTCFTSAYVHPAPIIQDDCSAHNSSKGTKQT
jgi:hypothetical protein